MRQRYGTSFCRWDSRCFLMALPSSTYTITKDYRRIRWTLYVDVVFHLCLLLDPIFLRIFVWTLLRLTFQRHCLLRSINKIENFRNHPLRDPFLVRLLLQYDHRPEHLSVFWPYSDSTRPIQKARIKIYQVLYDSTLNFSGSNNH